MKLPIVGIDHDNVYTVIGDQAWTNFQCLIYGQVPKLGPEANPYPGQWVFSEDPTGYSSTDSLIYP